MPQQGFSLIELLMGLAIGAIVLLLVSPAFAALTESNHRHQAAQSLLDGIRNARTLAITHNQSVVIHGIDGDWSRGWRIILDISGKGPEDSSNPLLVERASEAKVAIVGNWVLLFASYSRASIAIGTAVYNVQPFMLVGLAAIFLGEKITAQKLFWLGVSFLGMLAIVSAHGQQGESGGQYLLGIALALGAALLYAFAALIIKRLTGTPPHLIALIQVCTGVLLLAPWANWSTLPQQSGAWASLLTLGIVHTGVMYVLLYGAIQKLPTALTGALSFIYPIAAIFVDWFAFGHRLELLQWVGVVAILLAAAGMQQGWGGAARKAVTP